MAEPASNFLSSENPFRGAVGNKAQFDLAQANALDEFLLSKKQDSYNKIKF